MNHVLSTIIIIIVISLLIGVSLGIAVNFSSDGNITLDDYCNINGMFLYRDGNIWGCRNVTSTLIFYNNYSNITNIYNYLNGSYWGIGVTEDVGSSTKTGNTNLSFNGYIKGGLNYNASIGNPSDSARFSSDTINLTLVTSSGIGASFSSPISSLYATILGSGYSAQFSDSINSCYIADTINALSCVGNVVIEGNLTANNICYSNGTGAYTYNSTYHSKISFPGYTNIALTNSSNTFNTGTTQTFYKTQAREPQTYSAPAGTYVNNSNIFLSFRGYKMQPLSAYVTQRNIFIRDSTSGSPRFDMTEFNNILFACNSRMTATYTGFATSSFPLLCDNNYEQLGNTITAGNTGSVLINLTERNDFGTRGLTYSSGRIMIGFYSGFQPTNESYVILETQNTSVAGGFTWVTQSCKMAYRSFVCEVTTSNYITAINITLTAPAGNDLWLQEVEYYLDRIIPSEEEVPLFSKFEAQNLYFTTSFVNTTNKVTGFIDSNANAKLRNLNLTDNFTADRVKGKTGYFNDGNHEVYIGGTSGLRAQDSFRTFELVKTNSNYAGFSFDPESYCYYNYYDGSNFYGIDCFSSDTGIRTQTTNTYTVMSLQDDVGIYAYSTGTYAGQFDGDVYIDGALTFTGGSDPPYVLYFNESKEHIVELTRRYIPTERKDGIAQVYISSDERIKWFKPSDCGFYGEKVDKDGWVVKTLIETYDDGKICYNNNVTIRYSWDSIKGNITGHQVANYPKISIPSNKTININTGDLINK